MNSQFSVKWWKHCVQKLAKKIDWESESHRLLILYLKIKVLHGCFKPIIITLREYTDITLSVIELPFQKEIFSEKILEKTSTHYGVNVSRCDF